MVRRLLPPVAIAFVVFGVVFLATCMVLNIFNFVCTGGVPRWYLAMPGFVRVTTLVLCAPAILAAIGGPFVFGDSLAMTYFNLFFGQTLGYWLAGHAVNSIVRALRTGLQRSG
jgi:hypothetical protein